jgi:serine/threonine protein kinase
MSTTSVEFQLENYVLIREIGRGALTTTYEAERRSDGEIVAVKVIGPQFTFDDLFVRRFKDMAKQAARLEHPNIVRTYQTGQEGDRLYVERELIEARPLAEILQEEGPLSPRRMVTVARQIASALDYAHQKSITHGDLSAGRVYLGPNDHVTVADFGQTQALAGTSLVKHGYAVGTPEVVAPERVHGQGETRQSDYYSLGILCYQMLAGEPPFTGTPAAVLHAQAYEQPRPLHLVNPGISVALSETIDRMLSKGLELRYNTGAEFARALAVAIEGTAPIRAPATAAAQMKAAGLEMETPLWKRAGFWIVTAVLVIVVLLVLGFWTVSLWGGRLRTISDQIIGPLTPTPIPSATAAPVLSETVVPTQQASAVEVTTTTLLSEPTPSPTIAATPTLTPIPTQTPTPVPLPTPGPPVVTEGSPFTNLRLAHQITDDNQPVQVGTAFAPGSQPIYLFFDFDDIDPGTVWTHRWTWGDTELGVYTDTWPENYTESGTAWVYYSPAGGFQRGPYEVALEVEGQVVARATFVVEAGGL